MIDPLVVLLAVAAVLAVAVVAGLAGGWRPGGRSRRTEQDVVDEVRREFPMPWGQWLRVMRAVRRGRAAPEALRPAAYELARRTLEIRRESVSVRRPRLTAAIAVGVGLAVGIVLWVLADSGARRVLAVLFGGVYALGIPYAFRLIRDRAAAAVEANRG